MTVPTDPAAVLAASMADLRRLSQTQIQAHWRGLEADEPPLKVLATQAWQSWQHYPLNDRQHLAWQKGRRVLWLGQTIQVPADLAGYPLAGLTLRLALTWWAEFAQVFVDGQLVQEGDLFDSSARILLRESVEPGEEIAVALRLVSPGHDQGALVRSLLLYERPQHCLEPCPEPGFVADELAVVQHYVEAFAPEQLGELAQAIATIPWQMVSDRAAFDRAIATLRQQLQPWGDWIKQRKISLLGHAHLDLAWLWTVDDTWNAAERTFRSVLNLQKDFPELTFCHSSPALFAWLEENRPTLFAEIQEQVQQGWWEIAAGLWVEPELNVVSVESIARQILYGQRYVQEKFGRPSRIAWLPDTFGFPWQLPQLLKQGGIDYFVTQKLRWNDTTEFPHEAFWWRSPDQTEIFSLHSAPIGEGIDPLKMVRYASQFERKTSIPHALWLIGVGDHGGGPTRDMLVMARRWQRSPFFPTLDFTTAERYLDNLVGQPDTLQSSNPSLPAPVSPPSPFPLWNQALYLEFHRGCYTSHADQKRWNRHCERLLYQAELWAALATLSTGAHYPKTEIETAWKRVLFNQFHDILPGSAIPEVYDDANREWLLVERVGNRILKGALGAIAHHLTLPSPPHPQARPLVVFNSLNWGRSEVASLPLSVDPDQVPTWEVWDGEGKPVASQIRPQPNGEPGECVLSFWADNIPGVGYRCFWLVPQAAASRLSPPKSAAPVLENEYLQVSLDPGSGNLSRIFDKRQQREVLAGAGNQLQAFTDAGQYWDAWNIDPHYAQHPLPEARLLSLYTEADGPLETRIRVVRRLGSSTFSQVYGLQKGAPVLRIENQVDWQERHVLVKAAFTFGFEADQVTCEIPGGAISYTTRPATAMEKAQWEVPALGWADLGNEDYGVSLLTDYKHGLDAQPHQLRLTLLRSPMWPHPDADRGIHQFTVGVFPHGDRWQTAETVRRSAAFNQPLQVLEIQPTHISPPPTLPPSGQFIDLAGRHLILTTLKQSEQHPQQWILRCYEGCGTASTLAVEVRRDAQGCSSGKPLVLKTGTNLLEQPDGSQPGAMIRPWGIATVMLE